MLNLKVKRQELRQLKGVVDTALLTPGYEGSAVFAGTTEDGMVQEITIEVEDESNGD